MSLESLLESRLDEAVASVPVPGVVAALLQGDDHHIACRGVTSVLHPLPVSPETLFQIGSTIKTVTATALMVLCECGAADLDDRIRMHVPEFAVADELASANATLRHLLTHTAGWWGDLFVDTGRGDDALATYVAAMRYLPQLAPPGAHFSYSNTGFCLAGHVIERLTGLPYEQAVRELVLGPLEMTKSCFHAEEAILESVAVGHVVEQGDTRVARPWGLARAWNPAGGLVSSARDQLTWARFCLGAVEGPLGHEARVEMQRPHADGGGGRAAHVGLSWLIQSSRSSPLLSHGGSTIGQESAFVLVPEQQLAIVVMTNSVRGAALHGFLARRLLDDLVGPALKRPREPLPERALATYAGIYRGALHDFRIEADGDALQLWMTPRIVDMHAANDAQATGPMPVEISSGDRLRIVGGPLAGAQGEFLGEPAGRPPWLRLNGQLHVRDSGA
jgi:CubicO group peptidase (beta-lactamase class C family)